MNRRKTIQTLAKNQFATGAAVTYPDHPLLVRGPDILATDDDGLVAVFVHTAGSPLPSSRSEVSRIFLTRLALPRDTRVELHWATDGDPDQASLNLFDEITTPGRKGHVVRDRLSSEASEVTEAVRPFHFERFSEAWTDRPRNTSERARDSQNTTFAQRRRREGRLPHWATIDDGRLIARVSGRRSSVLPKVQTLTVATTYDDYGLDEGLAGMYDTAHALVSRDSHLALHSVEFASSATESSRTSDPFKPFRAAAFAGARVEYPRPS